MRKALILAAVSAFAAGGAIAQDVYVEEAAPIDEPYVDHRAYVAPEADVDADAPGIAVDGPRVYGWSAEALRPENCGTFKYWNGEYCADARYEPPASEE
jgi:hypothetical protein